MNLINLTKLQYLVDLKLILKLIILILDFSDLRMKTFTNNSLINIIIKFMLELLSLNMHKQQNKLIYLLIHLHYSLNLLNIKQFQNFKIQYHKIIYHLIDKIQLPIMLNIIFIYYILIYLLLIRI